MELCKGMRQPGVLRETLNMGINVEILKLLKIFLVKVSNFLCNFFMRPWCPTNPTIVEKEQNHRYRKHRLQQLISANPSMPANFYGLSTEHFLPISILHIIFPVRNKNALLTFTGLFPFLLSFQMERIMADTSSFLTDWKDSILLAVNSSKTHIFFICLQ